MTKKSPGQLFVFSDRDSARTGRHLQFMKALFQIDDPELERALLVILDRLAARRTSGDRAPPPCSPNTRRRPKLPQD
jgi:hypothetical protein